MTGGVTGTGGGIATSLALGDDVNGATLALSFGAGLAGALAGYAVQSKPDSSASASGAPGSAGAREPSAEKVKVDPRIVPIAKMVRNATAIRTWKLADDIGELSLLRYSAIHGDGGKAGAEIILAFKGSARGASELRWAQVVTEAHPALDEHTFYPAIDGRPSTRPFYHDDYENYQMGLVARATGYKSVFYDRPIKYDTSLNAKFYATATLLGNVNGRWVPLASVQWGFSATMPSGQVVLTRPNLVSPHPMLMKALR